MVRMENKFSGEDDVDLEENKMSSRLRHGILISIMVLGLLLASITVSYAETVNYFYDDLHRLIRVEYGSGVSIEYTYDQFGNRLQEVIRDIGAPTTTASPVGGIYNAPQTVTLTCSDGYGSGCDKIYYTTNGSTPTTSSPVYSSPINISVTTTLKFFAKDLAGNSEAIKTQNYIIDVSNRAPVALNDSYATSENVTLNIAAPGVLTNDSDPDGDSLTAILVSGPTHGTLTLNSNGSFTYTPNGNYNGPDSFTYKANDGKADSNVATVSIAVNPVNSQPVAISQPVTTDEDTPKGITLTGSDLETPAASLIFAVTSGPTHGTLSGTVPNLTYTPKKDYNGSDSFKFTVTDRGDPDNCGLVGSGCAAPKISPEATVSITINPVNDVPIANNQPVTTDEDVAKTITLTASNVDSTSLSFNIASGPSHGALSAITGTSCSTVSNGTGTPGSTCTATVTYTPDSNYNGSGQFHLQGQ